MGPKLLLPGGVEATVQVRGDQTSGSFTLITDVAPAGWSLPPHRHEVSETILVTKGRLWMEFEGRREERGAGESIHIHPGVRHAGGTLGGDAVERVLVFSPAGMERFFEALHAVTEPSAALELAQRHGWRFD